MTETDRTAPHDPVVPVGRAHMALPVFAAAATMPSARDRPFGLGGATFGSDRTADRAAAIDSIIRRRSWTFYCLN